MNKKGVIEGLQALIVPLIAIGLVLAIGFTIYNELENQAASMNLFTNSSVNESVIWTNATFKTLKFSPGTYSLTCTSVHNQSLGADTAKLIGSGNYTCDTRGINFTEISLNESFSTALNVSYTYSDNSKAINATRDVQNATSDIPGWIPIIIITIIGGLLLMLVRQFRKT